MTHIVCYIGGPLDGQRMPKAQSPSGHEIVPLRPVFKGDFSDAVVHRHHVYSVSLVGRLHGDPLYLALSEDISIPR